MKKGKILEIDVRDVLESAMPASTLSGVCLFQPDLFVEGRNFGSEIDHLIHINDGTTDRLLLIECKAQRIQFRGEFGSPASQEWVVEYTDKTGQTRPKFIKSQLFAQAQALIQNLYPRTGANSVYLHAIAVSDDVGTPTLTNIAANEANLSFHLLSLKALRAFMTSAQEFAAFLGFKSEKLRVLKIQQSDILRKVRHALVVPELGHPEVPNGMRFVARCREILDCELTKYFQPTGEGRWVINGAAGMGKTVLLAYAATAFTYGKIIVEKKADRRIPKRVIAPWKNEQIEASLPQVGRRKILLVGLSPKQVEILNVECRRFVTEFQRIAEETDEFTLAGQSQPPRIDRWKDSEEIRADVLLVDEAHDLSLAAQDKICEWWRNGNGSRYLVLACDRHQRLRLLGDHATILRGMTFSGCSTRLSRNYRSPSPIYAAALALMFRWFGKNGVKVIPSEDELTKNFGFELAAGVILPAKHGETLRLFLKNDTHPANYWSFTVARYTDWQVAYNWIEEWSLNSDQVLWVRFSHTDHLLDQQNLSRIQLRDLQVKNPDHTIDTHIKGREFPVVVIEGLPSEGADQDDMSTMLQWRRRLYLCASRATCFLFFVYPSHDGTKISADWNDELRDLLDCCSAPVNRTESASKFWEMKIVVPEQVLRPDVFDELEKVTSNGVAPESRQVVTESISLSPANTPPSKVADPIVDQRTSTSSISVEATDSTSGRRTSPQTAAHKLTIVEQRSQSSELVKPAFAPNQATKPSTQFPAGQIGTKIPGSNSEVQPPLAPKQHLPAAAELPRSDGQSKEGLAHQRMSEREFQRIWGQEKGWRKYYIRYQQTGNFPTHRPNLPRPATAPSAQRPQAHPAADDLKRMPPPIGSVLLNPKVTPPVAMSPKMIASHLGIKYFQVLKKSLEIAKRRGSTHFPQLETNLPTEIVSEVYKELGGNSKAPTSGPELQQALKVSGYFA